MRTQSLHKFLTYLLLCAALIFTVGIVTGCKGDTGAPGAADHAAADASFSNSGCSACHHMSDLATSMGLPAQVSGLPGNTGVFSTVTKTNSNISVTLATKNVPLSFSYTATDGSTKTVTATGLFWEFMDGLPTTFGANSTASSISVKVKPPTSSTYFKDQFVSRMQVPDRYMVVPANSFSIELAQNSEFRLWIFGDDGNVYYDVVKIQAQDALKDVVKYAPRESTGLNNVPVGMPVLLSAPTNTFTGYSWTISSQPGTAVLVDSTTRNPYFVPDVPGTYVIDEANGPGSITIYAGTWRGAISGIAGVGLTGNNIPKGDEACTGCHAPGTSIDKFTPWAKTGHAKRFSEALNGGGYGPSCFKCHTVGFAFNNNLASFPASTIFPYTYISSNGIQDQASYAAFLADSQFMAQAGQPALGADSSRYAMLWSNATYSQIAQRTNIQCENCHGPQESGAGVDSPAHTGSMSGVSGKPRVSMSSDVCGACHGAPTHHGRFPEWQESPTGHASFELAVGEGIDSTNPQNSNANCAGCHSAQGFLRYIKQLQSGNPLRSVPSFSLSAETVQPQTCVTCHDPHAEGLHAEEGFAPEGVTSDAQPRITGSTPKLPAGFAAVGVGKGAICFICHNSRNGGVGSTNPDGSAAPGTNSYLHEDNDPIYGMLTKYAAPHVAAQGDVLMGHNAYFMGNSGGAYSTKLASPHAVVVTDSCVKCHMEKTPPPMEYTFLYEGTNHTFKASMEICSDCHAIDQGLGPKLQMDTEAGLEQLYSNILAAYKKQANDIISAASGTNPIETVSKMYEYHGSPVVDLTFEDGSTVTGAKPEVYVPCDSEPHVNLAKAVWNYLLLEGEGSLGVHNPNFTRDVLGITNAKVRELF